MYGRINFAFLLSLIIHICIVSDGICKEYPRKDLSSVVIKKPVILLKGQINTNIYDQIVLDDISYISNLVYEAAKITLDDPEAPAELLYEAAKITLNAPEAPAELLYEAAKIVLTTPEAPAELLYEAAQIVLNNSEAPVELLYDAATIVLNTPEAPAELLYEAAKIVLNTPEAPAELLYEAAKITLNAPEAPVELLYEAAQIVLNNQEAPVELLYEAAKIVLDIIKSNKIEYRPDVYLTYNDNVNNIISRYLKEYQSISYNSPIWFRLKFFEKEMKEKYGSEWISNSESINELQKILLEVERSINERNSIKKRYSR